MVEGERGQVVDDMPGRVAGQLRVDVRGDEPEEGGCELAVARMPVRLAPAPQLFEMGDLADVDLRGELASDRAVERLVGRKRASGQGPGAAVGFPRALPQQRLEHPLPHLQHRGEHDLVGCCGRILQRFMPHSLKP